MTPRGVYREFLEVVREIYGGLDGEAGANGITVWWHPEKFRPYLRAKVEPCEVSVAVSVDSIATFWNDLVVVSSERYPEQGIDDRQLASVLVDGLMEAIDTFAEYGRPLRLEHNMARFDVAQNHMRSQ